MTLLILQIKAEAATAAAAAAAAESRQATQTDTDKAGQLYRKSQQMLAASSSLQQAIQRAADNTDMIEATAALLCTSEPQAHMATQTDASPRTEQEREQPSDTTELPPGSGRESAATLLYSVEALQLWLLKCCQASRGGMRDKPGKPPDYYHTCYCLSGLSSSQNFGGLVLGPASNKLVKADPLCNVVEHRLVAALRHSHAKSEYL